MKLSRIRHLLFEYFFCNYFAVMAIIGALDMVGLHFFNYSAAVSFCFALLGGWCFWLKKTKSGVVLMLLIVALVSISAVQHYSREMFIIAIQGEVFPMFAFFVGCSGLYNDDRYKVFERGIVCVSVVGAIGLYLYFAQPAWYVASKLVKLKKVSDYMYLEMTRLSAFWEYPYWISYGAAIVCVFLLWKMLFEKKMRTFFYIFLVVFFFIVVFLSQQRMPLVFLVSSFFVFFVYSIVFLKQKKTVSIKIYLTVVSVAVVAFSLVFTSLSMDRRAFITQKLDVFFTNKSTTSFVEDRASLGQKLVDSKSVSLFGDGLGRYGHTAFSRGESLYVTDQQYIKMLYETGLFGCGCRVLFILYCLLCGAKKLRTHLFPVCVIVMELTAMMGANSLASDQMHNVLFWYSCGMCCNAQRDGGEICRNQKKE